MLLGWHRAGSGWKPIQVKTDNVDLGQTRSWHPSSCCLVTQVQNKIKMHFSKLTSTREELDSQCPSVIIQWLNTFSWTSSQWKSSPTSTTITPFYLFYSSIFQPWDLPPKECTWQLCHPTCPAKSTGLPGICTFLFWSKYRQAHLNPAIIRNWKAAEASQLLEMLPWMSCMTLRTVRNKASVFYTDVEEEKDIKKICDEGSFTTLCFPSTARVQRKMGFMCQHQKFMGQNLHDQLFRHKLVTLFYPGKECSSSMCQWWVSRLQTAPQLIAMPEIYQVGTQCFWLEEFLCMPSLDTQLWSSVGPEGRPGTAY